MSCASTPISEAPEGSAADGGGPPRSATTGRRTLLNIGVELLNWLNASTVRLFVAVLLLGAILRPYAGLVHDANLYAVQTIDRIAPGVYSDDLYLRYGSQDRYSVFSLLAAPAVEHLGLQPAFFLLYLLSNAIFLFGLMRFVQAVVKPPPLAVLALIYLVVNPIPVGGLDIFHVHETFLTPRLLANGLVLLGLERMLRGQAVVSLALLAAAIALHPIMAFGGLLVYLCWQVFSRLSVRTILILAAVCGGATVAILSYAPLATALFGYMDFAWKDAAERVNRYCLPLEWTWIDWLRTGVAFGVVLAARSCAQTNAGVRRLLDAVLVVAAIAAIFGVVVPRLPYAILFQGQPYRAIWLLQLVATTSVFSLAGQLHAPQRRTRLAAYLSIGALAGVALAGKPMLSAALVLLAVYAPRRFKPGESTFCLNVAIAVALVAVVSCDLVSTINGCHAFATFVTPAMFFQAVTTSSGPLLTWLFAIALLLGLHRLLTTSKGFCSVAVAASLALQAGLFAMTFSRVGEGLNWQRESDVAFVEQYLNARRDGYPDAPTLYWPLGNLDDIWFTLGCKSYYVTEQTAGNIFSQQNAIEGERRAKIVSKFEWEKWKSLPYPVTGTKRDWLEHIYYRDFDSSPPTLADFYRLCRQQDVDVALLAQKFDGLYSATNGRWFIYDCRSIRDALKKGQDPASVVQGTSGSNACVAGTANTDSVGPTVKNAKTSLHE